jgi:hypothetical protein
MRSYLFISRRSVAGFFLLAAMLFYVSGAALMLHIALDHTHSLSRHAIHVVNADTHGEPCQDAPADAPPTPMNGRCQLCDMLAGATRPMMVVETGQPLFTTVESVRSPIPADSPAEPVSASDIFRRAPPLWADGPLRSRSQSTSGF